MRTVKKRAILIILAIVTALSLVFVIAKLHDKERLLNEQVSTAKVMLDNVYMLALQTIRDDLRRVAEQARASETIKKALAAEDRETLRRTTLPVYADARRHSIPLIAYILPDGRNILRMHDPDHYNDNILAKRPLIAQLLRRPHDEESFDVTLYGIGIVEAIPLYRNGTFVGIFHATADIKTLQKNLDTLAGIKSAIAFHSSRLKTLIVPHRGKQIGAYTLVSSNDPLFNALPSTLAPDRQTPFDYNGRSYILFSRELKNAAGEPIATILCAVDLTTNKEALQSEFEVLLGIVVLTIFGLALVLHVGFGFFIDRIEERTYFSDTLAESMGEGVFVLDEAGIITFINTAACAMLGYSRHDLTDRHAAVVLPATNGNGDHPILRVPASKQFYHEHDTYFWTKSGHKLPVFYTATPSAGRNKSAGVIVVFHDISDQKAHEEELSRQLYTDSLTLLPNRHALLRDLQICHATALILLNIDNFQEINDFYGYEIGDKLLKAVAETLEDLILYRPLTLYKMPSDEYALLVSAKLSNDATEKICRQIIHALHQRRFDRGGAIITLTLTAGIGSCPCTSADAAPCDILTYADMALKLAKKRRLPYLVYDPSMQIKEGYEHNIRCTQRIRDALDDDRFLIYYQPIIDAATGEIFEYEALLRMADEDGTIVPPAHFLPIARKSHLYSRLTEIVIRKSFKQFEGTGTRFSVNISADDIIDNATRVTIIDALQRHHVGPLVTFEILESDGIENYDEISRFINNVKRYGCHIAIDDFGSGYSNFAHIMRLDVDVLKIDGSLISTLDRDPDTRIIIQTIVDFAHRLGLKTVAEFVHSADVETVCRTLGIDYLQGYHLGQPRPLG